MGVKKKMVMRQQEGVTLEEEGVRIGRGRPTLPCGRLLKSHLAVDMHCDLAQREIGSYVNKDPKWAANIATWTIIEKSLSCRYTV